MFTATPATFRSCNAGFSWYYWWYVREACGRELN
jgi:hypothetical protein